MLNHPVDQHVSTEWGKLTNFISENALLLKKKILKKFTHKQSQNDHPLTGCGATSAAKKIYFHSHSSKN